VAVRGRAENVVPWAVDGTGLSLGRATAVSMSRPLRLVWSQSGDSHVSLSTVQRRTLFVILVVAAATRLAGLGDAPPGVNHDEASNGYDAYSILKTGMDRWGERWPIVLEAFGRADYRGALYAYLVVPFHAILGPDHLIVSTRLPAAVLGVLTIACLYLLVSRLEDASTGLWAAGLLTLSPWHLQLSRFGHESALTPACTVFALTLMTYAGWPFQTRRDASAGRLNPWLLSAAGAVFALSIYSYPSMRGFTPLLLVAVAVRYRGLICDRQHRTAIIGAAVTMAIVAAPMVVLTCTHWDQVMARAEQVSVFREASGAADALVDFARNYVAHFGPEWLVLRGDPSLIQWTRASGVLNACAVPFLMIGLVVLVRTRRRRPFNDILLAWLAFYPVVASLAVDGPHVLRSACGLGVFQWIAAVGIRWSIGRCGENVRLRSVAAAGCALALAADAGYCFKQYYVTWSADDWVYSRYQEDLCDALRAIRPIVNDFDHVFISDQIDRERDWFSGEAYILALLVLPVPPDDFHAWQKSVSYVRPEDGFHCVESFGPFTMTTRTEALQAFFLASPTASALLIARPGEISGGRLLETIRDERGAARFEIIAVRPAGSTP